MLCGTSLGLNMLLFWCQILDHYVPTIIELCLSAHTVFVHLCSNDVRDKKSIKLQQDIELAETTESLRKLCVIVGPIPTLRKGCEDFSRLYGFNQWLQVL